MELRKMKWKLCLVMTIAISIIGFMLVIIGIIYSQKRVLELLVEDTDDRMGEICGKYILIHIYQAIQLIYLNIGGNNYEGS